MDGTVLGRKVMNREGLNARDQGKESSEKKKKKTQDMGCLVEAETEIQIWEQTYQGQMEF